MEKRVLIGESKISYDITLFFSIGGLLLGWILMEVNIYLGIIIFVLPLLFFIKNKVVINYKTKAIHFYFLWFFETEKQEALKYQRSKVKSMYPLYEGGEKFINISYMTSYGLFVADIVRKQEKLLVTSHNVKELEIIAKELETNFGIIRV